MSYADPGAADVVERTTIRMPYLPDDVMRRLDLLAGGHPVVVPRSPAAARRVAERLSRQFHREAGFDCPPYLADEPEDQVVVLIPSRRRSVAYGRLFAGAVGLNPAAEFVGLPGPVPTAEWVYVHPYERGRRGGQLVERLWPVLVQRWPGLRLPGPYTAAGRALARRLVDAGLQPAELVHRL